MPPHISNGPPSLDEASRLVGQLNSDGLASLRIDTSISDNMETTSTQSTSLTSELPGGGEEGGQTSSGSEEEDYDNLQHDPLTVVTGGKGGGFDEKSEEQDFEKPKPGGVRNRPQLSRIKSIPIKLKKSDQKDKYILIADDLELKRLLKSGVVGVCQALPPSQHYSNKTRRMESHLQNVVQSSVTWFLLASSRPLTDKISQAPIPLFMDSSLYFGLALPYL
jgi:hypothetical protein